MGASALDAVWNPTHTHTLSPDDCWCLSLFTRQALRSQQHNPLHTQTHTLSLSLSLSHTHTHTHASTLPQSIPPHIHSLIPSPLLVSFLDPKALQLATEG